MGRNNWFEFKQFRIEQQRSAMKVGTDGVLLGAWAPVKNGQRILDAGTGTGLIALMLAQRSDSIIDAVEIDAQACLEAQFNFKKSDWSTRLNVFNADFHLFSEQGGNSYDLIVSNPPFFINSLKSNNKALAVARHNDRLSFGQLISGAWKLLRVGGRLCVIIPYGNCMEFRETARLAGFYLCQQTTVFPQTGKVPKRVLLEFSNDPCYPTEDEIAILDEHGVYTENYKILTAPYYPAF
jgi:tRNA1Val (adenine37-N6)-methyltransferase